MNMTRETAAQKAKREMEEAKAKAAETKNATSEATEGDIVSTDTNASTEIENATGDDSGSDNGDSGDSNGDSGNGNGDAGSDNGDSGNGNNNDSQEIEPVKLPEYKKIHAVALRDIPGAGVKVGRILLAPENIIKQWDAVSWVDTHDDALMFAKERYQQQKMADPRFNEPEVYELDAKGQIMDENGEG